MATLGQKPATQHVSTEKQTLTGNGGTSYTLQQSVSQAADIEVFVNNTRQEPTVAYTASGNTLTMTGAVNASDSFYVIFQGKAIQTAGLPVDAAITASTITASQSLNVTGHGSFTSNSNTALFLNRETSNGTIVDLQKDGTTVGSVGTESGDVYIAGTTHGLKFDAIDASTMYIRPVNNSGTNLTGHIDLGQAGNVFRDAYVSGGVYFAPNAYPANYLDDYEEGTFTPDVYHSSSNNSTFTAKNGEYTKIGNTVTAQIRVDSGNSGTAGSNLVIGGLPYAPAQANGTMSIGIWGASGSQVGNVMGNSTPQLYKGGTGVTTQISFFTAMLVYKTS